MFTKPSAQSPSIKLSGRIFSPKSFEFLEVKGAILDFIEEMLLVILEEFKEEEACSFFLDSIEKLLNTLVEQRTEVLLQKARLNQLTPEEKRELQTLLNEQN